MNIWKDRDGKVSFNRIVATFIIIIAVAFLGKAWWDWKSLPEGIPTALCILYATVTGAMKVTDFALPRKSKEL